MDLRSALRSLNLGVDVRHCPDCDVALDLDYVRDPHTQDHWRGVRAHVCPECGYAERADERLT